MSTNLATFEQLIATVEDPAEIQQILDRAWVEEHGNDVARAILELLYAAGFGVDPKEVLKETLRKIEVPQKRKVVERVIPKPSFTTAPPPLEKVMRYVAGECAPGQSDGKKNRPSTMPRNGSHYVSKDHGDDSPGWHNLIRAMEDIGCE